MPIPYDLYIRFLATKGIDDVRKINSCLQDLSLPAITQVDLDSHWSLIHNGLPANIVTQIETQSFSGDFMKNMNVMEVRDLWLNEAAFCKKEPDAKEIVPYVRFVYDIHQDSSLRLCINALLMKRVSFDEISRILSSKFSIALKEKHLAIYAKYFFDVSRMTKASWKSYISKCSGKEAQIYFTALTESVDVLKTELDLPALMNVSDSLQWLLTKSFLKAKTFINMNTVEAGREARAWIDQVVSLTDKYEKHRSGDQHDFAKALQMEFEFVEEEFGTPDDDLALEIAEKTGPKEDKKA